MRGNSHNPAAAASTKKMTIFAKTHIISLNPPLPDRKAKTEERIRMTRMSSKTAAPKRASPTRVRSTCSSISTWAEMETDVAPSVSPKNSA